MTESVISKSSNLFLNEHPLVIRIKSGPYSGQDIAISSEKCLIRGQFQNQAQCAIYRGTHHTVLQDIAGNTCLNGNPIQESRLQQGDMIQCGDLILEVESLQHQENRIHFRPQPSQPSSDLESSQQADSMLAKLDGIQENLKQLDESSRIDPPASRASKPASNTSKGSSSKSKSDDAEQDDSFQQELKRMHGDLVGQIGKCRRDLVRLTQEVKSQSDTVSQLQDAANGENTDQQFREQSEQLNQLVQSLNQLRAETTIQIEAKLDQFQPEWRNEFAEWKSETLRQQSELESRLSGMQNQFASLQSENQNHSAQLGALEIPKDCSDDIRALQQQSDFSMEQNSQILDRVDRLTDSLEQMSELLKRQVSRNVDFEQKLAGIESTIADLDQTIESRLEKKSSEQLGELNHQLASLHTENQKVSDTVSEVQCELQNQLESQRRADSRSELAQQKLEQLAEKMADLETCQANLQTWSESTDWQAQANRLSSLESSMQKWREENRSQFESNDQQQAAVDQSIEQLRQWQQEVQTELRNWGSRTESLDASLETLKSDLGRHRDTIASTVSDNDQWRSKWEDRQEQIESNQQNWSDQTGLIADSLERLRFDWEQKNQEWADRARAYEDSVDGIQHSMEFAKSESERWQQSSHDLDQSIKDLNEKYQEHWLQMESLQQATQTLERSMERLQSESSVTPESFADLQNELHQLRGQMETISSWESRFEQMEARRESSDSRIDSCESQIQSVQKASEANRTRLESIQSDLQQEMQQSCDRLREEMGQDRDSWKAWQANTPGKEEFERIQEYCQSLESTLNDKMKRLSDSHSPEQFQAFQSSLNEYKNEVESLKSESPEDDSWNQLSDRLDAFQKSFNDLQNRTEEQFEVQSENQRQIKERMDAIGAQSEERLNRFDAHREDFEKWSNEQDLKSNRIDGRLEEMNSSFEEFKSRLDQFNLRLDTIESQNTENRNEEPAGFSQDWDQQLTQLRDETVGGIRSDLDQTSREFESAKESFRTFSESYECRQKDLDEKLADVHLRLDEQTQWTELKQQFESLQNRFDSLEEKWENAESSDSSPTQEGLGVIEERLAATIERVEQFENMKDQLQHLEQAFSDWKTEPGSEPADDSQMEIQPGIQIDEPKSPESPLMPLTSSPGQENAEAERNCIEQAGENFESETEASEVQSAQETESENADLDSESDSNQKTTDASLQFEQLLQQLRESDGVSSQDSATEPEEQSSSPSTNSEPEATEEPTDSEEPAESQTPALTELPAENYQQGQQRAQELENIYEQAVDSVQPTREPQVTGFNMQEWAQSLTGDESPAAETEPESDPLSAQSDASSLNQEPNDAPSDENPTIGNSQESNVQETENTDSKLEDILSRLSSNDGWSGVIKEEEQGDSEFESMNPEGTESEVIVEGNPEGVDVEVVDAPAAGESVADVLSRLQMEPNFDASTSEATPSDASGMPAANDSMPSGMNDESPAPLMDAAPAEPAMSPEMPAAESSGSSDVSVQEYMSQLFGRLRGDEEADEAAPITAESKAPVPTAGEPVATPKPEKESEDVTPLSAAEYVPQHQAPSTNLDALRKLANETTREAVSISVKKKTRSMKSLYLGLAVGSAVVGGMMFFMSKSGFNMMSLLSIGLIAAAAYCGFKYVKSNGADEFGEGKPSKKKAALPLESAGQKETPANGLPIPKTPEVTTPSEPEAANPAETNDQ